MDEQEIRHFVEAALLAAGRPLSVDQLQKLFDGRSAPDKTDIRAAIGQLNEEYASRGITIAEVASGFRIQVRKTMADQLHKLWEDRPPRYSRALFETLALVAYRQPITRGEIEEIRGVSVSSNIVRTLLERDWVRVVGHRDVPGRPAMFGTTRAFLDYFGLKKLDDLPELADLSDWESLRVQLDLPDVDAEAPAATAEVSILAVEESEKADQPARDENDESTDTAAGADSDSGEAVHDDAAPDDELVVSEWPDPADSSGFASFETSNRDDDKDASAGSG